MAAFTLSAIAAVLASDASVAAGSQGFLPAPAATIQISQSDAANPVHGVTYAAPHEVTQPTSSTTLPTTSESEKVSDDVQTASSLAEMVSDQAMPTAIDEDMRCLASAVYYEAKSESLTGQLAVARVIINRARSGRFASSLCGVVRQPSQFSFVRGGTIPQPSTASNDWHDAVAIAQIALKDAWQTPAEGALFFHARRVSPSWGKARLASIDNHIFYR